MGKDIKIGKVIGIRLNKETNKFYTKELPVCPRCQLKYSKEQFLEGVNHELGGAWDK
jgi:hypothetical protein